MKRFAQLSLGCFQLLLSALAISALWWAAIETRWLWLRPSVLGTETLFAAPAIVFAVYCGLNGRRLIGQTRFVAHAGGHIPIISYLLTAALGLILIFGVIAERAHPNEVLLEARLHRLIHPQRISGSISDATTGQAIEGLVITAGSPFADHYSWSSPEKSTSNGLHFETVFRQPLTRVTNSSGVLSNIVLQFAAPGYETVVSSPFQQQAGSDSFDLRIKRATMSTGRVIATDGTPVARASVLILSKATATTIYLRGTKVSDWNGDRVETDDSGRFRFARPAGDFHLLVADERGLGAVGSESGTSNPTIVLQPWARLEGHWSGQSRPKNVQELFIRIDHSSGISISAPVEYSSVDGHFVVSKLPPGTFSVSWQAKRAPDAPHWSLGLTNGEASPGQIVQVECSTIFRTVTGRLSREGSLNGMNFAQCGVAFNPMQDSPAPKTDDLDTPEKIKAWWTAWSRTAAGRAYAKVSQNQRQLEVQPDGRFACAYVTPGKYWVNGWWLDGERTRANTESRQIEIGSGDGPIDIGQLVWEPERVAYLPKGAKAPTFEVPGVVGADVSLDRRPGKFVIVDFWATDCSPCVEEIANVRAVFEKYGAGDRLAVLSLDLDADPERAQRFIRANRMVWPQGFLKGGWQNSIARAYGVDAIPAIFLVSPDGQVIDRDMRGSGIEAAVARALSH